MKKFARIENNIVREFLICEELPEFTPDFIWIDVTNNTNIEENDTYNIETKDYIKYDSGKFLREHLASMSYKERRGMEYPPIGDQLDALWKGGDAAIAMLALVQNVKAKYPKG